MFDDEAGSGRRRCNTRPARVSRLPTAAVGALPTIAAFLLLTACVKAPLPRPSAGAPQRICSVSLAGDELLALLVPPERVACVSSLVDSSEFSNVAGIFPPEIPRLDARIEPVLAAEPDLVLAAPWNQRGFLDLLERSGVRWQVLDDARTFSGIRAQLVAVGRALGVEERAGAIANDFDQRLARLDDAVAGVSDRPRVLSFSHLVVAGEGTTVDALMQRAGARNAAAELRLVGHAKVSVEQILAVDPDVLLLGYDPGQGVDSILLAYPFLATTRASRAGRVVVIPPRQLTTVSPFLVDGALALALAIHPELSSLGEGPSWERPKSTRR